MYGVGNGSTGSWRDMQHGVWLTAIYCMYGVISSAAQVFAAVPVSLCVHASFLCGNMFGNGVAWLVWPAAVCFSCFSLWVEGLRCYMLCCNALVYTLTAARRDRKSVV